MATTYKWDFYAFDTAPSENGLNDVVKTIYWRLIANNGTHNLEVSSNFSLPSPPDQENFIEFHSLTEELIVSWFEKVYAVQPLKDHLNSELEKLVENQIVTRLAPWVISE
jgi:hypothetical protein